MRVMLNTGVALPRIIWSRPNPFVFEIACIFSIFDILYCFKLSYTFGLIKLENLNVNGMVKNHCLAKSISDSGWGLFGTLCEYKAVLNGARVEHIDRFFPSSKLCRHCGTINNNLKLHHHFWICDVCGAERGRDVSAAINILNASTAGDQAEF